MEVIPAEPAGDIHTFANEINTGLCFCHHGFGRERSRIHPTDHHLGGAVAFGAGGGEAPLGEALCKVVQLRGGEIGNALGQNKILQHQGHQSRGQEAGQDGQR